MLTHARDFLASPEVFLVFAQDIMPTNGCPSETALKGRFRALFGVSENVCSRVWFCLLPVLPSQAIPFHFLWALMFLKTYASEHVNSTMSSVDAKTFRKWSWKFIKLLADILVVRYSTN